MSSKKRKKNRAKTVGVILAVTCAVLLAAIGSQIVFHDRKQAGYAGASSSGKGKAEAGETESEPGYKYNDHLSNYLFMGIDTRDTVEGEKAVRSAGQADAILLVSYDRAEDSVKLLVIPRDTMTEIDILNPAGESLGLSNDHINVQYGFGDGRHKSCNLMTKAVSNLLNDIPVQGYCAINLDGIVPATKEIGGVELTVPDDSLEEINADFKKGTTVTITEENVEQFVRYRDVRKTQSALVRQGRQKVFLKAYMEKARSVAEKDASLVTRLYEAVNDYMVTNMSNDLFSKLLIADQSSAEMETIPGEVHQGKYHDEYRVDREALDQLILKMFYAEK